MPKKLELEYRCQHRLSPACRRRRCLEERGFQKPSSIPPRDPIRYAPPQMKRAVFDRDGYHCRYCQKPLTLRTGNTDHVKPWRRGGPTEFRNLAAACGMCNKLKGNNTSMKPMPLGKHRKLVYRAHRRHLREIRGAP